MARFRFMTAAASAALGIAVLTGCNGDALTDFAIEEAIESQIEADVDFDFDFDGDGGFNLTTEDGSITFGGDSENGSIVFDTDEGSGTVNLNDDGSIVFDTDQGSGTVTVSETGQGGIIASDDGSRFAYGLSEAPAEWPAIVGTPSTPGTSPYLYSLQQDANGLFLNGEFSHAATEDFAAAVGERFLGVGYTVNHHDPVTTALVSPDGSTEVFLFRSGEGHTSVNIQVNA